MPCTLRPRRGGLPQERDVFTAVAGVRNRFLVRRLVRELLRQMAAGGTVQTDPLQRSSQAPARLFRGRRRCGSYRRTGSPR